MSEIKPMDSNFASLGEALCSYYQHIRISDEVGADLDSVVVVFCEALGLPRSRFDTSNFTETHFVTDAAWIAEILQRPGWYKLNTSNWLFVDSGCRPIATLTVTSDDKHGINVDVAGAKYVVDSIVEASKGHISASYFGIDGIQPEYSHPSLVLEYVNVGFFGGKTLQPIRKNISKPRKLIPDYYPQLNPYGGPVNTMKAFLESDAPLLILYGAPGTGKTSFVAAAAKELQLLPMYVSKPETFMAPKFITDLFTICDRVIKNFSMVVNAVDEEKLNPRRQLFGDYSSVIGGGYDDYYESIKPSDPFDGVTIEELRPVIVLEDADQILGKRTNGNERMTELLNELDGPLNPPGRKMIITTNLAGPDDMDEALLRTARCFAAINFGLMTSIDAYQARAASNLPTCNFEDGKTYSLAEVLDNSSLRSMCGDSSKSDVSALAETLLPLRIQMN